MKAFSTVGTSFPCPLETFIIPKDAAREDWNFSQLGFISIEQRSVKRNAAVSTSTLSDHSRIRIDVQEVRVNKPCRLRSPPNIPPLGGVEARKRARAAALNSELTLGVEAEYGNPTKEPNLPIITELSKPLVHAFHYRKPGTYSKVTDVGVVDTTQRASLKQTASQKTNTTI